MSGTGCGRAPVAVLAAWAGDPAELDGFTRTLSPDGEGQSLALLARSLYRVAGLAFDCTGAEHSRDTAVDSGPSFPPMHRRFRLALGKSVSPRKCFQECRHALTDTKKGR